MKFANSSVCSFVGPVPATQSAGLAVVRRNSSKKLLVVLIHGCDLAVSPRAAWPLATLLRAHQSNTSAALPQWPPPPPPHRTARPAAPLSAPQARGRPNQPPLPRALARPPPARGRRPHSPAAPGAANQTGSATSVALATSTRRAGTGAGGSSVAASVTPACRSRSTRCSSCHACTTARARDSECPRAPPALRHVAVRQGARSANVNEITLAMQAGVGL
eukprot:scaffold85850_cov70-Phaeocystis_antarctica.AAC.3